ncbi:MAG: hypothetical protein BWZ10_03129 [candidate division BRC1 bacterium ADurb.BinA364]|nr:MAG: hypothetical protein BWZ10_03129 [candidate division BRC1 bacterium ADurb.BinA364]
MHVVIVLGGHQGAHVADETSRAFAGARLAGNPFGIRGIAVGMAKEPGADHRGALGQAGGLAALRPGLGRNRKAEDVLDHAQCHIDSQAAAPAFGQLANPGPIESGIAIHDPDHVEDEAGRMPGMLFVVQAQEEKLLLGGEHRDFEAQALARAQPFPIEILIEIEQRRRRQNVPVQLDRHAGGVPEHRDHVGGLIFQKLLGIIRLAVVVQPVALRLE